MSDNKDSCVSITIRSVPSTIRASDGRDVPFTRARLAVRNGCSGEVTGLSVRASLGQEGGTVQDVTKALAGTTSSLHPGEVIDWDVFDTLLPAHAGTASRLHMFGYRAVLNWKFELSMKAEYRVPGSPSTVRTASANWTLQWIVANPDSGSVGLTITE